MTGIKHQGREGTKDPKERFLIWGVIVEVIALEMELERRIGGGMVMETDIGLAEGMARRRRFRMLTTWGMLGAGVAATFGGPAILSGLLEARAGVLGDFFWLYFGILMVLMGVAYVTEWRTRGRYMEEQLLVLESNDGGWSQMNGSARAWRYREAGSAVAAEIFLFAPRLVFEGWTTMRAMRAADRANVSQVERALRKLIVEHRGIPVERLRDGNDPLEFGRVMAYLVFYEWAGVSEDGRRVWILTESLRELGLEVRE